MCDNVPMSLRATAARVLEASGELQRLQNHLADLDRERASVEGEIQKLLTEIAGAAAPPPSQPSVDPAPPPAELPVLTSEMILVTVRANPDKTFSASDFVRIWDGKGGATIIGFRAALSRLSAQGKIRRVRFGWYTALN